MCADAVGRTMAAPAIPADEEDNVRLIQVKVIEGVFTAPQKREIIERLTDAMVAIEGEEMRPLTWCLVEEVQAVSGASAVRG